MSRIEKQGDVVDTAKGQADAASFVPVATNSPELEVKDAQLIFNAILGAS